MSDDKLPDAGEELDDEVHDGDEDETNYEYAVAVDYAPMAVVVLN